MTAQIDDYFNFEGDRLSISGISEKGLFSPSQLGMDPEGTCTACWRGYQEIFKLSGTRLVLDTLHAQLFSDRERYIGKVGPVINGVSPVPQINEDDWFNNHYYNLNYPIDYTGGLLLTSGFYDDLYVHMGFHPAWKYEYVIELIFSKGGLIKTYDRSKQMANIRNKVRAAGMNENIHITSSGEEIQDMIDGSFERTYRPFL